MVERLWCGEGALGVDGGAGTIKNGRVQLGVIDITRCSHVLFDSFFPGAGFYHLVDGCVDIRALIRALGQTNAVAFFGERVAHQL